MRSKLLIVVLISFLVVGLTAHIAFAEWAKTIRLYPYSIAQSVKQTKDGGYIILATHRNGSTGKDNFWVIKLKNNSDIEWQKTYGLKDEYGTEVDDYAYAIEQTSDGGYIIVGKSRIMYPPSNVNRRTWIIKIDETGNIEWQKAGNYQSDDTKTYACDIKQTNDGGYVLADTINIHLEGLRFGLMKLNHDGSFAWRGVYGNIKHQYLSSMQVTDDGGYIIAGHTRDSDDTNFSIVRINSSGSIVWQKQYASDDLKTTDTAPIIRNTPDGGFIVGGYTRGYGNDTWVIKLDSDGNILWQKRYYDPRSAQQNIYDIKYTSDGGYIFVGITEGVWIVKINSDGSILWDKAYPIYGDLKAVRSVDETSDGGYIIGGAKMFPSDVYYDVLLMKINENGDIPDCSLTKEEGFTVAVDIYGKAFDSNYSQGIITSNSIIDTDSSPITSTALSEFLCEISNHIPTVNAGDDLTITSHEMSTTIINGWASDEDDDPLDFRWLKDGNEISDWQPIGLDGEAFLDLNTVDGLGVGQYNFTLKVTDWHDTSSDQMTLSVENSSPDGAVLSGAGTYALGSDVILVGQISDFDGDIVAYQWKEDSNVLCSGTVQTVEGGEPVIIPGDCTAAGFSPGVYTITLQVNDGTGDIISPEASILVVVYDPNDGFVTGGGWIDSPTGAYSSDPSLTGKANFGFVSKYNKGAEIPTGQTEFQFRVADLNFHSDSYDWLVVAGPKAKYKGTGTINGEGNYGFMLTAIDEKLTPSTDVDLFRIKIWDKDNEDFVVYDNQMDEAEDAEPATEIGGGSIVIHNK